MGDVFEVLVDLVLDPALMVGPPAALVLPGERILDVLEPSMWSVLPCRKRAAAIDENDELVARVDLLDDRSEASRR